jgi:hypothetical protein
MGGVLLECYPYHQSSACGHAEPRPRNFEAKRQRQFALGVGPQRQEEKA